MIRRSKVTLDQLQTLLVEVESIINFCPLTYVSARDLEEPLTPSHLLMGRRVLSLPDNLKQTCDIDDEEFINPLTSTQLKTRMNRLSSLLNHFWMRWRDEYLTELHEAHWRTRPNTSQPPISVGDVVVIHDEDLPRGFWRFGKVEDLIMGRDGEVRGATVRLSSGSVLRCPVQRLYPLVLSSEGPTQDQTEPETSTGADPETEVEMNPPSDEAEPKTSAGTNPTRHSSRIASQVARDRLLAESTLL